MQLVTWLRTLTFAVHPFAGRTRGKPARRRPPARQRLLLEMLEDRLVPSATPILYVGDNASNANGHSGDNTVQSFDATDPTQGVDLGTFVKGNDSLKGVRGLIFDGSGHLLVANQNVGRGKPGEILRYDASTGAFQGELVPFQDPHAPFAPRGIVLKDNVLYVANLQDTDSNKAGIAPDGEVDEYNATTGSFLGALSRPAGYSGQFNPRAVVFGPDGKLYVSVFDSSNLKAGYVVRYDVATSAGSIFAFNNGDGTADSGEATDLHRPEGLTFGPNGQLYVTGYRADATDTDKIVIIHPSSGAEVDTIVLDTVGQPRAYGQGILFGPGDRLFVPISTLNVPDTGAIRSYDVTTKMFDNFEPLGTLGSAWYLTFRNTDPATLAYVDPPATAALPAAGQSASPLATTPARASQPAGAASTNPSGPAGLISNQPPAPSRITAAVAAHPGNTHGSKPTTPAPAGILSGSASTAARDHYFAHHSAKGSPSGLLADWGLHLSV
jgi:hypothetical protein